MQLLIQQSKLKNQVRRWISRVQPVLPHTDRQTQLLYPITILRQFPHLRPMISVPETSSLTLLHLTSDSADLSVGHFCSFTGSSVGVPVWVEGLEEVNEIFEDLLVSPL